MSTRNMKVLALAAVVAMAALAPSSAHADPERAVFEVRNQTDDTLQVYLNGYFVLTVPPRTNSWTYINVGTYEMQAFTADGRSTSVHDTVPAAGFEWTISYE